MRVLVTGARLPAALEIASGLSSLGVEVLAADSLFFSPTGTSRSVIQYLRFPSPRFSFSAFRKTIVQWVEQFSIDLIIPVSEEIFYFAQLQEELKPKCTLFAPSFPFLRACHSKWDILDLLKKCGISTPATVLATSEHELHLAAQKFSKYIIKPEFSRGAYDLFFDVNQIKKPLPISSQNRWLIQEYVTGQELCSYSIALNGTLLAHAAYEPYYRLGWGASLYFKPVELCRLREQVVHFVKKYSFTGQISFDYLITKDDLVVLECNPRATSGIHMVAQNKTWGRAFLGETIVAINPDLMAPRAAKLPIILFSSLAALRKKRFLSFITDLNNAKDTVFNLKDPAPIFGQQLCSIELMCLSMKWRVHPKNAYTFDLEWNGQSEFECE